MWSRHAGKYWFYTFYTFYNVQYSPPPPGSPSSVIFHHILLYNRRHFNWRRHNVPTCLARLDPARSPVPILHSLQSRAKTWQSVDLGPPSNSARSFSSTFYGPEELGFQFNAISNFHFKVLLKILFTFLVAWERTGGNFARSNCQNALFCTPQCPDQRRDCGAKRSIVQITKFTLESNYKVGDQLLERGFFLSTAVTVLRC